MLKKFSVASVFMLVGGASIAAPLTNNESTQNNTSSSSISNLAVENIQQDNPKPNLPTGPIVTNQLIERKEQIAYEAEQARIKAEEEAHQKAEEERLAAEKKAQEAKLAEEARQKALLAQQQAQAAAVNRNIQAPPTYSAPAVSAGSIQEIIVNAANKYGMDANTMLRIARCESGYNPNAINYGYTAPGGGGNPAGLFQHLTGYWPARAAKYGWAGASVFDAQANAEVTAQMARDGGWGPWECK